jgi:hypothetical protein
VPGDVLLWIPDIDQVCAAVKQTLEPSGIDFTDLATSGFARSRKSGPFNGDMVMRLKCWDGIPFSLRPLPSRRQ